MPLTQAERDFCFHFYQEESRHLAVRRDWIALYAELPS